jgi:hypothetical protein
VLDVREEELLVLLLVVEARSHQRTPASRSELLPAELEELLHRVIHVPPVLRRTSATVGREM